METCIEHQDKNGKVLKTFKAKLIIAGKCSRCGEEIQYLPIGLLENEDLNAKVEKIVELLKQENVVVTPEQFMKDLIDHTLKEIEARRQR